MASHVDLTQAHKFTCTECDEVWRGDLDKTSRQRVAMPNVDSHWETKVQWKGKMGLQMSHYCSHKANVTQATKMVWRMTIGAEITRKVMGKGEKVVKRRAASRKVHQNVEIGHKKQDDKQREVYWGPTVSRGARFCYSFNLALISCKNYLLFCAVILDHKKYSYL